MTGMRNEQMTGMPNEQMTGLPNESLDQPYGSTPDVFPDGQPRYGSTPDVFPDGQPRYGSTPDVFPDGQPRRPTWQGYPYDLQPPPYMSGGRAPPRSRGSEWH
ncbi:unnamed protein product [Cylicostephanus goldi]|uniref:Uncharacterized protein n=1 Tax=Cylicostephanus goldi TaxID=71465 RepID=A0A3P7R558_CYLGO|nr:unnamed protein product [Cylicostephanus goldi]